MCATLKDADVAGAVLDRAQIADTHWWEAICSGSASPGVPHDDKRVWSALYHASGKTLPHEAIRLNSSVHAFVDTVRRDGVAE